MMASLYPRPLSVDEVLDADRHRRRSPTGAPRSSPAARPSACASRSRWSATRSCSCSTSRPSRWTSRGATPSGRRCATFAAAGRRSCSRRTTSRRPTPTPTGVLMARGRVVADGPTTEIKAMVGVAHDPRHAAATPTGATLAALPGRDRRERRGEAVVLACSDSDAAIRALLERSRTPATSRSAAPASRRRSCSSPATTTEEEAA